MLCIALFILCASNVLAEYQTYDIERADQLFEKFIIDHNRKYESQQEKEMRFNFFIGNLHEINNHNREHRRNVMGINRFADMSKEEFRSTYLGCTGPVEVINCTRPTINKNLQLRNWPTSFDWRDYGIVTRVKNQLQCASCWAFSTIDKTATTGNIESQYALKYGTQLDLSEQQEVDCDKNSLGCIGGWVDKAILNLMDVGGLMLEEEYPYIGVSHECMFDPDKVQVKVTDCLDFSGVDEETIKAILIAYGPLTVALGSEFMAQYDNGVLMYCGQQIDHALLIVGYGTDEETQLPYWILKNSWGENVGEKGYVRLLRGSSTCQFGQYSLLTSQVA